MFRSTLRRRRVFCAITIQHGIIYCFSYRPWLVWGFRVLGCPHRFGRFLSPARAPCPCSFQIEETCRTWEGSSSLDSCLGRALRSLSLVRLSWPSCLPVLRCHELRARAGVDAIFGGRKVHVKEVRRQGLIEPDCNCYMRPHRVLSLLFAARRGKRCLR